MTAAMHIKACVIALALVGCSKGPEHWAKRPVKPLSKTVAGVAFTIELPEGMVEKPDGDGLKWDFEVERGGEKYIKTPWVMISSAKYADKTLDAYMKSPVHKDVTNWVRKDTLPDGYVVSYENPAYKGKDDYLIERVIVGDPGLDCTVRLGAWERGDDVKAAIPQAEKMCTSIKLGK